MNFCGTEMPGWISGGHPTISDGIVQRQVCFSTDERPCRYAGPIHIKACLDGDHRFYVYRPSASMLRWDRNQAYCGSEYKLRHGKGEGFPINHIDCRFILVH